MMKLDGLTLRSIWAGQRRESTYLGIQRFIKKRGTQLPAKLQVSLIDVFNECPESAWKATFLKGLDGDQDAQDSINAMGQWETLQLVFPPSADAEIRMWVDQLVEIEKASQSVDLHLSKSEFAQAAALAAESPALRPYLSPAAIATLSKATSGKEALFSRAAGMCEVLLSQVARVEYLTADWPNFEGGFSHLILCEEGSPCKPGRQFFSWMRGVLGVKTLAALQVQATRKGNNVPVIDESTLKRWNSGREFPRAEKLNQFINALEVHRVSSGAEAVPSDRIYAQYWAVRRLQKLLDLARPLWEAELRLHEASQPWSDMMGHRSAEAWIQTKYLIWQNHWNLRFSCPQTISERT